MTFFDEYHAGHVDRAYDVSTDLSLKTLSNPNMNRFAHNKMLMSVSPSGDGAFEAPPSQSGQRGGASGCVQELQ